MKEDFPIFLWKHQCFDKKNLQTVEGDDLLIIQPGLENHDAGPDFRQARIIIDGITWVGWVEVHVKSSQWKQHRHHFDPGYDPVILHVVWEYDTDTHRMDGTPIPILALKPLVDIRMLARYKNLSNSLRKIPCEEKLLTVDSIQITAMLNRTALQRMEQKAEIVADMMAQNYSWEEATCHLLARNFGFRVNQQPFQQLVAQTTYKLIRRHSHDPFRLEALLFGMAGFLKESAGGRYYQLLRQEYLYLSHKFGLQGKQLQAHEWRFLRMRPANFPTVRLAQFAALYALRKNLFSIFKALNSRKELVEILSIKQSDYWQAHYFFDKESKEKIGGLGEKSIDNLIINTVAPLKIAYGKLRGDQLQQDAALELLEQVEVEDNKVTRIWKEMGVPIHNALEGQGSIQLFHRFCIDKKCLNCNIGVTLLKPV